MKMFDVDTIEEVSSVSVGPSEVLWRAYVVQ